MEPAMAQLVTVGWFTEPWEAYIAQGRLQAEGVFSCIAHEHHVWMNWMYSHALGQVKLQVLVQDGERASDVLARYRRGEFARDLETEFGHLQAEGCPACGSVQTIERVSVSRVVLAFVVWGIFGVAYPPRKNLASCDVCQYHWRI